MPSRIYHDHSYPSGPEKYLGRHSIMMGMETYNGHVRTPADAIILFEACRIGLLPRVQRRLSEKERQSIKSGSVFVWDEREAGMRRWTDGKSWSASRVSGSFLTYREMEGKRGGNNYDKSANAGREGRPPNEGDSDGGPDGYRYKPDGLMKQSFSITTNNGQHLHLISYYSRSSASAQVLMQPSSDPQLRHIRPEKGMYPESTVHEQSTIPAVTRGPMSSPGYTHSPHQSVQYGRPPPSYGYAPGWAPPSPMHTPPPHPQYGPYYHHAPYPGQSPLSSVHSLNHPPYPAPTSYAHQPPPMTAFDRPPPPLSNPAVPQNPYAHHPPHHQHSSSQGPPPPPPPSYQNGYSYPPPGYPSYPQHPGYPPAPPHSHRPSYESRPSDGPTPSHDSKPPSRPESYQSPPRPESKASPKGAHAPPPPPLSSAPASTGQTIPSISAMLNDTQPPIRTSSRSPNGTPLARPLQDIPSHKLGFEANRDVQALRNLDKSTFKF